MLGMFTPTHHSIVTIGQAHNALLTILGDRASTDKCGTDLAKPCDTEQFVAYLKNGLQAAVPH
jgi:hypothetical protein